MGYGTVLALTQSELEELLSSLRNAGFTESAHEETDGWRHTTLTHPTGICNLTIRKQTAPNLPTLVALLPDKPYHVYERAAALTDPYLERSRERLERERLGWIR
jgi:hypothetical protein